MSEETDFTELAEEKYGDKLDTLEDEQLERLEELFEEKLDKYGKERLALTSAVGSFNFEESSQGAEHTVYTIGCSGPREFNGPTLFCYGVIDPEDRDPERVAIVVPENNLDASLEEVREMFTGGFQEITANVSFSRIDEFYGGYKAELGASSGVFNEVESPERNDEEIRELIYETVPEVDITTIGKSLTETNEDGWPKAFGVDFKLIRDTTLLEANVSGKGARYVLQDDSFLTADELPPEVRGEDNDLGLIGFADPETMSLDSESVVDVFGTINPTEEGKILMDIFGYYGHYEQEIDVDPATGSDGSGGGSDTEVTGDAVDERTI